MAQHLQTAWTTLKRHTMVECEFWHPYAVTVSDVALHARLQANPLCRLLVDTMTGIGATFGLV